MQMILKISFWFSVALAVLSSILASLAGNYFEWYLAVAFFAIPGFFIDVRAYKAAAILIFCIWSFLAYEANLAGEKYRLLQSQLNEKMGQQEPANPSR